MREDVIKAFEEKKTDKVVFEPEIKVKRSRDTLYISEMRRTKVNYLAMVEVGVGGDKAPVPLGMLDEKSLKIMHDRLTDKLN